jgi:hypothetical protein
MIKASVPRFFPIISSLKTLFFFQTEDEGNHGNDDTRCFILSTLASQGRSKVHCVLCEERMPVFDRYPLVDGTFFLSPRQHAKGCIEVSYEARGPLVMQLFIFFLSCLQVKVEGRTQFLTVVCMACLEGVNGRAIICRFCNQRWDGSSLVLGTMYSYDIFAAMPCCTERIKVSFLTFLLFALARIVLITKYFRKCVCYRQVNFARFNIFFFYPKHFEKIYTIPKTTVTKFGVYFFSLH